MAQELSVHVGNDDHIRLERIVGDRNCPHKHVQRARIVLLSADRLKVAAVACQLGVGRPMVWRWQRIALTAERLEEREEQLRQLGLGDRLPGAFVALRAEIDDREKRIAVARQPRLRRIPHVRGLWGRGGYRHFAGWKSAVKDMIRP